MAETAVLVTGVAGFIGYYVARELLEAGDVVVAPGQPQHLIMTRR